MNKEKLQEFMGRDDLSDEEFAEAAKWHSLYNSNFDQHALENFLTTELSTCVNTIAGRFDSVDSAEMYSLRAYLRLLTNIKNSVLYKDVVKKDIKKRIKDIKYPKHPNQS